MQAKELIVHLSLLSVTSKDTFLTNLLFSPCHYGTRRVTPALAPFHALCNYIISSYYNDKQRTSDKPSETVTAWKALLPLGDMLLANLKAQEQYLLYSICLHLVAMVRFGIFNKIQGEV